MPFRRNRILVGGVKGYKNTKVEIGCSLYMSRKIEGILVGIKGFQVRWDQSCLQRLHMRGEAGERERERRNTIYHCLDLPRWLVLESKFESRSMWMIL